VLFDKQPAYDNSGAVIGDPFQARFSYGEFDRLVNRACHYLHSCGIKPGDVYNLHLPNCPAFLVLWFAGTRLGAVMMPTNVLSSVTELSYLLEHSQSRISFTTAEHLNALQQCQQQIDGLKNIVMCDPYTPAPAVDAFESQIRQFPDDEVPCSCAPDDIAAIMYTSGTTSKPKGVMVTHANYIKAGTTVSDALELTRNDRHFAVLPLFHGNAQYYSTMSTLISGASIAVMDRFSASQYFDKCAEYRCSIGSLFAAPMRMILAQPENSAHHENALRVVIYAQNITEQEAVEWHRRFNAPLSQIWGMTETMGPPLMNPYRGERRNWTVGKPAGGYDVRLVDQHGMAVQQGQQGEITVKGIPGETIMSGYFKNEEATRNTIRGGWLYTGDNAVEDEQGFFRFVDRVKDMIKRSGENISAAEVESVVQDHPAIYECAVVGIPDPIKDESIVVVAVLNPGMDVTEIALIDFCASRLAKFRVPQQVVFRESLPKTSVGKIQKNLLREELIVP
jgi:crotonobetaine/carnitine-CoA ligase